MHKTVVITGASRGIGYALTKYFLNNNFKVIGTSRTGQIKDLDHKNLEIVKLDLSDLRNITQAVNDITSKFKIIDILINNAGIGPDLDFLLPEKKIFADTFSANVTGTVFFTESLLNHINENGKLVNVSSKMGSIELCKLSDSVAYRMSKSALNMYTKILSNRLLGKQPVAAIHPGWVKTTIAKSNINGRLSADESAMGIYNFVTSDFKTGIFCDIETQSKLNW